MSRKLAIIRQQPTDAPRFLVVAQVGPNGPLGSMGYDELETAIAKLRWHLETGARFGVVAELRAKISDGAGA